MSCSLRGNITNLGNDQHGHGVKVIAEDDPADGDCHYIARNEIARKYWLITFSFVWKLAYAVKAFFVIPFINMTWGLIHDFNMNLHELSYFE